MCRCLHQVVNWRFPNCGLNAVEMIVFLRLATRHLLAAHLQSMSFSCEWVNVSIIMLCYVDFRFVNPALVSPYEYGLAEMAPTPKMRRGLMIASKILQVCHLYLQLSYSSRQFDLNYLST